MPSYKGYLRWDKEAMGIGGEARSFTLTWEDNKTVEAYGDSHLLRANADHWVIVTGEMKMVGVENRREAFVVETLTKA